MLTSLFSTGIHAEDTADLILVNGRVYTLEENQPWAEALAIKGEWILAVGTNADARQFKGPDTREIDVGGAFVSPGFNDAHVHVDGTGRLLTGVNLLDVHEAEAFKERIEATTGSSRLLDGTRLGSGGAGSCRGAGGRSSFCQLHRVVLSTVLHRCPDLDGSRLG